MGPAVVCTHLLLPLLARRAHCCDSVAWNPECSVLAYCDEAPDPNTRDRSAPLGVVGIYAPPPSK